MHVHFKDANDVEVVKVIFDPEARNPRTLIDYFLAAHDFSF